MKSLSTRQTELSARRELASVPLVKITTYTDRVAKTGSASHYFSDRPVRYDYGNTGTIIQFEPFLMEVGDLDQSIPHLANPNEGGAMLRRDLTLTFRNGPRDGTSTSLFTDLITENLLYAEVEFSELLIDTPTESLTDATALTGDEHVFFFRGVVKMPRDITAERFTLDCKSDEPPVKDERLINLTDSDPRDVGQSLNRVYGDASMVPLQNSTVGLVSTLSTEILKADDVDDTFTMTSDGTGWPTTFDAMVGGEQFAVSRSGSTLTISARSISGTPVQHQAGELIVELIDETVFVVAGHHMESIDKLYALSPLDDQVTAIDSQFYTATIAESGGDYSGEWASIRITKEQQRALIIWFISQTSIENTEGILVEQRYPMDGIRIGTHEINDDQVTSITDGLGRGDPTDSAKAGQDLEFTFVDGAVLPDYEVEKWTIVITPSKYYTLGSASRITFEIYIYNPPTNSGRSDGDRCFFRGGTSNVDYVDRAITSNIPISSVTTTGSVTVADFIDNASETGPYFVLSPSNHIDTWEDTEYYEIAAAEMELKIWTRDISVVIPNSIEAPSATRLTVATSSRFFVDGQGVDAPDSNYDVASGTLLQNPPDIARHLISEVAGLGSAAIDSTTWGDAETELTAAKMAFVVSDLGTSLDSVLARLAWETRSQIIRGESSTGTIYKMLIAADATPGTYTYTSSGRAVTEWDEAVEDLRDTDTMYTRWRWLWSPDRALAVAGAPPEEFYRELLQADPDTSDLTGITTTEMDDAEKATGRNDKDPLALVTPFDSTQAINVAGFYTSESIRQGSTVAIRGVPWTEAYDLELGDVFDLQLDWWSASRKMRLLGYRKSFQTHKVDIVGIEVL